MKRILIACFLLSATIYAQDSEPKHLINYLKINSSHTDYAASFFGDDHLVFSAPITIKGKHPKTDLFIGKIDETGSPTDLKIIGFENRTVIKTGFALTNDHNTVYFSAKNKRKGKEQLFKATINTEGLWTNIKRLPFNDSRHHFSSPTLSPDNTKLYFVSNNRQSYGGTDIFVVTIKSDGEFEEPVNVGNLINSIEDEITPYVSSDNVLYYSSNGLQNSQGGFDIYKSHISEDGFTAPEGLAAPINGLHNDFAYIINSVNSKGYFTSNRLQGDETNNMYSFLIDHPINENCEQVIAGIVKDKETALPIVGAEMILYDNNQEEVSKLTTDETGAYSFTMDCNTTYTLIATGESYDKEEHVINTANYKNAPALAANKFLTKTIDANSTIGFTEGKENVEDTEEDIVVTEEITASSEEISSETSSEATEELSTSEFNTYTKADELPEVNAIYFDFDKSYIKQAAHPQLDEIVTIMKENPEVSIAMSAYTDSRGPKSYNLDLSQRRLKSTMRYLENKGIAKTRLSGEGYGEENITNQCTDGVPCSRANHKKNRRTEFNFILNNTIVQLRKKEEIIEAAKDETFVQPEVNLIPKEVKIATTIPATKIEDPIQITTINPVLKLEKQEEKNTVKTATKEENSDAALGSNQAEIKKLLDDGIIVESTTTISEDPSQSVKNTEPEVKAIPFQTKKEERPIEPTPKNVSIVEPTASEKELSKIINLRAIAKNQEEYDTLIDTGVIEEDIKFSPLEKSEPQQTKTESDTYARLEEMRKNKEKLANPKAVNIPEQEVIKSTNLVANATENANFEPNEMLKIVKEKASTQEGTPKEENLATSETTNKETQPPVKINAVSVTPMTSKRGKYTSTDRAKKIQALRVNFSLLNDPNNPEGYNDAYIVIKSPNDKIINQTGTFELASGEAMGFTDQTTVLFADHDIKVVMFIDRIIQKFVKGEYKVEIYFNGTLSASTKLSITG